MAKKSNKITLGETWKLHFRAYRDLRNFCPGVFASSVLYNAARAVSPYVTVWFSAQIINELAGLRRADILWLWVIITVICSALMTLLTGILEHWKTALYGKYTYRKAHLMINKTLSLDFADADSSEVCDLRSQISANENWSGYGIEALYQNFQNFTYGIFGVIGAISLTVTLFLKPVPTSAGKLTVLNHPGFAVGIASLLLIATCISAMCGNRSSLCWAKAAEACTFGNRLFGYFGYQVHTELRRHMDVRMYNQQDICESYFVKGNTFGADGVLAKTAKGPMGLWSAASAAISALLTGAVYVFVCLKAWGGAFGVGSITQYVGAVTALSANLAFLIRAVGEFKNNVPFMRTVYEYLDIPNNMYQGSLTTEKRSDKKYDIEFKDVSFKYPNTDTWALRHVNIKFKVGNRLAIVGENGSGKTTFIKLLCRLYDPQEGEILLNGIDIRKYNYRDYMDIFSVVFQDFQLVCQPLGANVAGAMEYDKDRVEKALIDAGFGERLSSMEKGLDTMLYKDLTDDGVEVSGGEAQKIAIARALYKDAPFIILDEPTAALDPIAEAEIYSKFNEIVGDKTAIYISHRLSSCKFCDEIAVFSDGSVVQYGFHNELLADENGKYHELWNAQAQYYAENE